MKHQVIVGVLSDLQMISITRENIQILYKQYGLLCAGLEQQGILEPEGGV